MSEGPYRVERRNASCSWHLLNTLAEPELVKVFVDPKGESRAEATRDLCNRAYAAGVASCAPTGPSGEVIEKLRAMVDALQRAGLGVALGWKESAAAAGIDAAVGVAQAAVDAEHAAARRWKEEADAAGLTCAMAESERDAALAELKMIQAQIDTLTAPGTLVAQLAILRQISCEAIDQRDAALAQVGALREAMKDIISKGPRPTRKPYGIAKAALALPAPAALAARDAEKWDEGFKAGNDYAFDMVDKPDAVDPKRFDNPYRAGNDKGAT